MSHRLLSYPDHGYLYVSTDWHGDYKGFLRWLGAISQHIRYKQPKYTRALILGDVINPKSMNSIRRGGDKKILRTIDSINAKAHNFRIDHLQGNHEYATALIYQMLTARGIRAKDEANHDLYSVFSFVNHMDPAHYQRFTSLPYAARTANGIVFTHGGLPRNLVSLDQLANPTEEEHKEIVESSRADYEVSSVRKRLAAVDLIYSVSGHKSLRKFSQINQGVACLDNCRVVFTSNIGFELGRKTGLCIDLRSSYRDLVQELHENSDIVYLE